jgi:hypothetical protein
MMPLSTQTDRQNGSEKSVLIQVTQKQNASPSTVQPTAVRCVDHPVRKPEPLEL